MLFIISYFHTYQSEILVFSVIISLSSETPCFCIVSFVGLNGNVLEVSDLKPCAVLDFGNVEEKKGEGMKGE